jgi:hypothetical protein
MFDLLRNFILASTCTKWLKDRKDRKLEFDDIAHYQKKSCRVIRNRQNNEQEIDK